jgi:hypothetical protein
MQIRDNAILEKKVNRGIISLKLKGREAAYKFMTKAGIPIPVIDRVLFEPHRLRSTDWY